MQANKKALCIFDARVFIGWMSMNKNYINVASIIFSIVIFPINAIAASEFTISGEFDGCEYGKLFEIEGGGILECKDYNYHFAFYPRIIAQGRNVITIDNEKIEAYLHNGSVVSTRILDTFEGCDYEKPYKLQNGMIFVCQMYRYKYAYRPEVKIFLIENASPKVFIGGEHYNGKIYRMK
ncbi:hypothetical protein [Azospirillum sp. B2RO_4]|uniref:hypothetical protein n=1 Tax=Azospirillum sp. B2RO_4 TaxID=3027796 RepID=UPI003DA807D2